MFSLLTMNGFYLTLYLITAIDLITPQNSVLNMDGVIFPCVRKGMFEKAIVQQDINVKQFLTDWFLSCINMFQ